MSLEKDLISKQVFSSLKDLEFTIVGKGDFEDLENMAAELGISTYVNIVGEVSDEEKVKLLNSAWVYSITSTKEGWGLTVIEANACGTHTVAYNVPGLKDSIIYGETGLLTPYGNVEALAQAIIKILLENELRETLSRNAVEWSKQFSWNRCAEELMRALELAVYDYSF